MFLTLPKTWLYNLSYSNFTWYSNICTYVCERRIFDGLEKCSLYVRVHIAGIYFVLKQYLDGWMDGLMTSILIQVTFHCLSIQSYIYTQ